MNNARISALNGQAYLETVCFQCPIYSRCQGGMMEGCMWRDKKTASIVRQEMVEEIKREIEKRFLGSLSATSRGIVQPQFFRYEWEEYWEELKRKWGVK